MFDDQNNNQQSQDTNGPLQAAMPDPIDQNSQTSSPQPDPINGVPNISVPVPPVPPAPQSFSAPELPVGQPAAADAPQATVGNDELINLKQQALQHLSPLVGHLDQTPEEKFRTTMMMIQASDNHNLIQSAFEAAQNITDDKARAQALLDVINEINYFTQQQ